MYLKETVVEYPEKKQVLVALADAELIGRELIEGEMEITVNPRFYKGKKVSLNNAVSSLKRATTANLIGKKAVNAGVKAGVIDKENIKIIQNVPFAIMVKL